MDLGGTKGLPIADRSPGPAGRREIPGNRLPVSTGMGECIIGFDDFCQGISDRPDPGADEIRQVETFISRGGEKKSRLK